jgi:prepilin-type N-terminal cleavage/methylation domain-containing protein
VKRRRGFSLIETTVVLLIGVVVTLSLWPLALDLLRRQQRLTAGSLTVKTFALLHDRLAADFGRAASYGIEPLIETPSFRLTLAPREPGAPEVIWDVAHRRARRTERRTAPDGTLRETSRTWGLDGRLSLERPELLFGRCVLLWEPDGGLVEYLAFVPEPSARVGS